MTNERSLTNKDLRDKFLSKDVDFLDQATLDAIRTEPDYVVAIARLRNPGIVRLLHAAMGMCTESAEFVDALKKHIFYGKAVDEANIIEEVGDSTWYERIACDELNKSFREMIERNVAKLKVRYPDKFSEDNALNRDLNKERKTLE